MASLILPPSSVRAVIAGTKTQHREPVRPQPERGVSPCHYVRSGVAHAAEPNEYGVGGCTCREIKAPWFVGDEIWVRETWWANGSEVAYRADGEMPEHMQGERWRSAATMPRWASRLSLRVLSVRVERLQEIGEEDARAEGYEPCRSHDGLCYAANGTWVSARHPSFGVGLRPSARAEFACAWDMHHAARFPWSSNPWVWRISFERVRAGTEAGR